ncbi:MAG: GNAT family N-acetyltransferase, partial [Acidimicrobiales bacterium]
SVAFAAPGLGDRVVLHSHVTAVSGARHRTGVGGALKLHQRAWALEHGFEVITWTFDPLVARNARFNLSKLAARVDRYLVNLYGELDDVINSGGESDRLLVRWDLADDVVAAAAAGKAFLVDDSNAEDVHKVALPADIELLRKSDPTAARAWRLAMRGKLAGVLDHGGQVLGLAPSGEYVVQAATPRGQSR